MLDNKHTPCDKRVVIVVGLFVNRLRSILGVPLAYPT